MWRLMAALAAVTVRQWIKTKGSEESEKQIRNIRLEKSKLQLIQRTNGWDAVAGCSEVYKKGGYFSTVLLVE